MDQFEFMKESDDNNENDINNTSNEEFFDDSHFKKSEINRISKNSIIQNGIIILICVIISFIGGIFGGLSYNYFFRNKIESNIQNASQINDKDTYSPEKVVELVADSVVDISTEIKSKTIKEGTLVNTSAGSGVVYSEDGYIITNEHVISNQGKITVTLKNGRSYGANIVATDKGADLAVLKIGASGLTPAVFGDSSKVKLGEETIVIGNPLGELSGTVTDGVVSAINREVEVDGKKMRLLQTCAEINSGNSGGGVFKSTGELIGVVIAKSSGEDIEGLGFAIPSNTVKSVVESLLNN